MSGREDNFIAAVTRRLRPSDRALLGDDAALVANVLVANDVLVEGVDYRNGLGSPEDVGWRAVAANVSDIAAMGGTPVAVVVGVVLGDRPVEFWELVYQGIARAAGYWDLAVAGGDVSSGAQSVVSVSIIGTPGPRTVWRKGARPGDGLYVDGQLGGAAAGLAALAAGGEDARHRARAWLEPMPSVAHGQEAATSGATAMIDISDGLSTDALRIAAASDVAVEIETALIPVDDNATLVDALSGGEDYKLLFTLPPDVRAPGWAIPIGRCRRIGDGSWLVHEDGTTDQLEATGWDHLESRPAHPSR